MVCYRRIIYFHVTFIKQKGLPDSPVRVCAMTLECARIDGINLAQGVCDTEVPLPVRQGVLKGMDAGFNTYTRFDGLAILGEAIARKMADYNGLQVDPDTEVIVSSGSTGSFYCACIALLNPVDEVILFDPYHGYNVNTLLKPKLH
ncbi:MAG TPA: hypothetical protein DDX84_10105 [Nitrospiraceae bacterium]|nr:hypothetical protein [Nitrospiraceae bacterium]